MPTALYHFTCRHGARAIQRSKQLRPNHHPLLGTALVWLTDLPDPDRWGLGLTSNWITCDRTAMRVCVPVTAGIVRWRAWALWHQVPRVLAEALEDDGRPDHWWVAEVPLSVSTITDANAPALRTGGARG
ncbi:hypothetical protein [Saccharopolyspora phatthalungensis]|uniref:Uncharacterized protein n=1 Tax=Saccharopolyspora phatthalungensis TaxID=664693 RepID=A0A840Q3B3_9PSEU|nr:hypothetical protein [Saccharopolyspora phatthalungensis]MBB5154994.1 hypothetical protein [Saccharopolyspora phatthalungensis]